ncbi:glycosylhydrolase family 76-5 [Diaporthe helianthi]|uniref:Mannan endo-1,6-alpha-mannosidase n=1 Tax=Diaporthe helianthi TaxID=158607 RepID=A0A2P5I1K2_DIAHE|nr:glycosylhydrolase family 76-5 [Diaporthe helianthi]
MTTHYATSATVLAILTKAVAAMTLIPPMNLNLGETTSIKGVARTIVEGALSYYPGNATTFIDLPSPYYWWECGALMGALLDYSHYTQDTSYDGLLSTALSANIGPQNDLMITKYRGQEGNDDQSFWTFNMLTAAERNLPQVEDASVPSWLQVAQNSWNSLSGRWNTSACGGGLLWQIFPENPNGLNYRNSVSNGGLFQISARLYRATGNRTYLDWANKVWDWSVAVKMIDQDYFVYDGANSDTNCTDMNPVSFSYSAGIYLYGAAVLANATDGDAASTWTQRTEGLLQASRSFFSPYGNATNIMYEHACETVGRCNTDMKSFKGYLSRFMYASAVMLPSISASVKELLGASATAAANACSGGDDSVTCGQKWYVGGFDGSVGLGQQMCALETVQGQLARQAAAPLGNGQIKDVRGSASAATSPTVSDTGPVTISAAITPTDTENAGVAVVPGSKEFWATLSLMLSTLAFAMV